jgi:tetratricopeptide (TPR) repeat protein
MKKIWLGLAVVIVGVIAASIIALPRGAEWTTDSPEALAEFNAAIDAKMKLYHDEVQVHLEKAIELDPDFVIAKLYLANDVRYDDEDRALRLWNDVLTADHSDLTPREIFFVDRARAYQEKRFDDAAQMIEDYLTEYPDDPYILHEKALKTWGAGEFDEAERLNRRLIEIAPNWVLAYNQLGYIAMSQGRFVEAEEYFTSYRFVAPDQANPHDSLGELYIILGRIEEAEASLRQSIAIKPDFWNAFDHLALTRLSIGDVAGAEDIVAEVQAVGNCPDYWETGIACLVDIAGLAHAEQWTAIADLLAEDSPCLEGHSASYAQIMKHRAAMELGDIETALSIEEKMETSLSAAEKISKLEKPMILGALSHLRAVRMALQGDHQEAIEAFRNADENMTYIQAGNGLFKLQNRIFLVETLFAAGRDADAHKVLSKVRSVNSGYAQEFEEKGLKVLGLERE